MPYITKTTKYDILQIMNKEDKQKIETSLNKEISALTSKIEKLTLELAPIVKDCSIEKDVRIEAIMAQDVTKQIVEQSKQKLSKLQNALLQLKKPTFGTCAVCDEPIDVKRMLIAPESTKCIECSTL